MSHSTTKRFGGLANVEDGGGARNDYDPAHLPHGDGHEWESSAPCLFDGDGRISMPADADPDEWG